MRDLADVLAPLAGAECSLRRAEHGVEHVEYFFGFRRQNSRAEPKGAPPRAEDGAFRAAVPRKSLPSSDRRRREPVEPPLCARSEYGSRLGAWRRRAATVSPMIVTSRFRGARRRCLMGIPQSTGRGLTSSVAEDPAPLDTLEVRARRAASEERAHRTLRYQRAALPAGQFSMAPTVSYPSRG